MSAFGGKADVNHQSAKRLFLARNGPSKCYRLPTKLHRRTDGLSPNPHPSCGVLGVPVVLTTEQDRTLCRTRTKSGTATALRSIPNRKNPKGKPLGQRPISLQPPQKLGSRLTQRQEPPRKPQNRVTASTCPILPPQPANAKNLITVNSDECPLWVISRLFTTTPKMSAFGGKAEIIKGVAKSPLSRVTWELSD